MVKKIAISIFFGSVLFSCTHDIVNEHTGMYIKTNGLHPEQVNAFDNQIIKNDKTISFGHELTIEILGVDDFVRDENGKVFPGGENVLVSGDSTVIYYVPDYFKKYELTGVNPEDAAKLKFNLRIGKPMEKGETYNFLFKLWDKKSDKELKGNIVLEVK
jgi:hypothetical protein